jgi:signal transduction histidine kinase
MRHNIFLVVKEALTNVLKHSGAREVHVQVRATANTMEFIVQDDGAGFSGVKNNEAAKRNGLTNMQRRAETMNGKLNLESMATGTTVSLVVTVKSQIKKKNN